MSRRKAGNVNRVLARVVRFSSGSNKVYEIILAGSPREFWAPGQLVSLSTSNSRSAIVNSCSIGRSKSITSPSFESFNILVHLRDESR